MSGGLTAGQRIKYTRSAEGQKSVFVFTSKDPLLCVALDCPSARQFGERMTAVFWFTGEEMDNVSKALHILSVSREAKESFPYYHRKLTSCMQVYTEAALNALTRIELQMIDPVYSQSFAHREYLAYLESSEWRKRADACKARAGNRCQMCNSGGQLQAHHRTYDRLYCEQPDDLIALCDSCHGRFHGDSDER